ncbi:MAG: biopolymer transporter ExbD [Methylococcaceae bacterium]|jgi:biopolymer transport protein ExbD|nr:biopolymer transporter ExbD [Methylococcaceae bacterium]
MEFRRKRRRSVEIGLIPMIDVLLVLLFFFMVATTFRHQADIKLDLPKASVGEQAVAGQQINLFVLAEGGYRLDTGEASAEHLSSGLESLKSALQTLPAESKQWPFIINADGKASHQAVISVLDLANQLGFYHFSFAVDAASKHE